MSTQDSTPIYTETVKAQAFDPAEPALPPHVLESIERSRAHPEDNKPRPTKPQAPRNG